MHSYLFFSIKDQELYLRPISYAKKQYNCYSLRLLKVLFAFINLSFAPFEQIVT